MIEWLQSHPYIVYTAIGLAIPVIAVGVEKTKGKTDDTVFDAVKSLLSKMNILNRKG